MPMVSGEVCSLVRRLVPLGTTSVSWAPLLTDVNLPYSAGPSSPTTQRSARKTQEEVSSRRTQLCASSAEILASTQDGDCVRIGSSSLNVQRQGTSRPCWQRWRTQHDQTPDPSFELATWRTCLRASCRVPVPGRCAGVQLQLRRRHPSTRVATPFLANRAWLPAPSATPSGPPRSDVRPTVLPSWAPDGRTAPLGSVR